MHGVTMKFTLGLLMFLCEWTVRHKTFCYVVHLAVSTLNIRWQKQTLSSLWPTMQ